MDIFLQPNKDNQMMREFGPWTAIKLDYLARYIDIFETSMHAKPWRRRNYIDLFAGPGKCVIPENNSILLGSPLLAITTAYPFTDYFFVDQDLESISVLQTRCQSSPIIDQINFYTGDSNKIVNEIVDIIISCDSENIPGKWSSLNLAFIDPDGLELNWNTVVILAKPYTMDLIIHYPQMGLSRSMPNAFKENPPTAVDSFFGGNDWRNIYEKHNQQEDRFLHRQLMDLYKGNLSRIGYKEVLRDDEVNDEPLMRNVRGAPLYRLLFASKHELGHDFWHKITMRDLKGQRRLF